VMLALAIPTLREWRPRTAAGTGAAIAVALTPVLPAGLPVLAALGGLATIWRPRRGAAARESGMCPNPDGQPALRADSREPDDATQQGGGDGAARESDDARQRADSAAARRETTDSGRLDADNACGLLTGGER